MAEHDHDHDVTSKPRKKRKFSAAGLAAIKRNLKKAQAAKGKRKRKARKPRAKAKPRKKQRKKRRKAVRRDSLTFRGSPDASLALAVAGVTHLRTLEGGAVRGDVRATPSPLLNGQTIHGSNQILVASAVPGAGSRSILLPGVAKVRARRVS